MAVAMARGRGVLCLVYGLIALAALVATWSQNLAYFAPGFGGLSALTQFVVDLKVNPAARSIGVDIALICVAAITFMVIEARRLNVRFVWAYVLGAFTIAISVTFPLFLLAREIRLAQGAGGGAATLRASDWIGLALVYALVGWLCWFILV